MDERSINSGREQEEEKVFTSAKTGDTQGMGSNRQRSRGSKETRNTSNDPISMEAEAAGRGGGISERDKDEGGSSNKGFGKGECKAQRGLGSSGPGVDTLEKKDELGLTGRQSGQRYSQEQKERIIGEVDRLKDDGMSVSEILKQLGVPRSTFYSWRDRQESNRRPQPVNSLLETEEEKILSMKNQKPYLSHRHISGLLRHDNIWVSPSSCYRRLKEAGLVWEWSLREAPWRIPKYEPFRPNQIWGEDWTGLVIKGVRHYVLTILDLFSRYVIAWGIVKTVTQSEVKNLVALAIMSEGLEDQTPKPILRTDPGSPNMASDVRVFLKEMGVTFSPGRTARPTDNARQERFYRTLKQEEIYCHDSYHSVESARSNIAKYIDYYNNKRPHQALFGYPPDYVHKRGNKTGLMNEYTANVALAKEKRREQNLRKINQQPTTFFS